jgi:hypothetical protein
VIIDRYRHHGIGDYLYDVEIQQGAFRRRLTGIQRGPDGAHAYQFREGTRVLIDLASQLIVGIAR